MSKRELPLISVLMSVYRPNEEYLRIAIESILNQSYANFEFLIIIDGADAITESIIKSYNDSRIKVHINPINYGLTKSLNIGLDLCIGKYIARMDADDYSYMERLEKQCEFMELNSDVTVVGSYARNIGMKGFVTQLVSNNAEILRIRMMFYNAGIVHPSAFIRKEFLTKYNMKYDERIKKSQDYALWTQIVKHGKISLLPNILLGYRRHEGQIINSNNSEVEYYTSVIRTEQWEQIGVRFTTKEINLLKSISAYHVLGIASEYNELYSKLTMWNREHKFFNDRYFRSEINRLWLHTSIKKALHDKKMDMLLHPRSLKALNYSTIIYCLNFYIIDKFKPYFIEIFKGREYKREI